MATQNPSLLPIVPPKEVRDRLPISQLVPSKRNPNDSKNPNVKPKNKMIWSLYVRALTRMKERDMNLPNSYFQLAGIHGYPFIEWAKRNSTVDKSRRYGYCTHSQVLFPTWHRIYALAYEQVLREDAMEIAKGYKSPTYEGLKWADVASDLRQPYWDWADNIRTPPQEIFGGDNVLVIGDDGQEIEFSNPLLRFRFPDKYITELQNPDEELAPDLKEKLTRFSNWESTVRNPDINSKEDVEGLLQKFKRVGGETTYKTLMMLLSFETTWEYFSNNGMRYDRAGLHNNSLEAVHDDIHMFSGKGHSLNGVFVRAHMTDLAFAAFDPIFWLHHANVDRLLAIWQVLHPGIWVSDGQTREPTLNLELGETVGAKTSLEPFYQESGEPWTSELLQNTAKLGYSYPDFAEAEIEPIDENEDNDFINTLTNVSNMGNMFQYVYELYGYKLKPGETNEAIKIFAEFFGKRQRPSESFEMYDWGIHASFKKYEVKSSFTLVFYFADGVHWDAEGYYIGSVNAFHGLSPETCTNCKKNEEIRQEGYVPLTYLLARSVEWETKHNPTISKRTKDDFSHPEKVLKYLKDRKLTCRLDGAEMSQLESLELTLHGTLMRREAEVANDKSSEDTEVKQGQPVNPEVSGNVHSYSIKKDWTEFRMLVDSRLDKDAAKA